jgi:hypothetical protein
MQEKMMMAGRLAVAAVLCAYAALQAQVSWPVVPGTDVAAFLGVGQALRDGVNPYSILPTTPRVLVNGAMVPWPNANPPALLPLLALLAPFDPLLTARIWFVVSLALYAALIWLLCLSYPNRRWLLFIAWTFALVPLWYSQWLGQIYVPLALTSAGAWLALRAGRSWLAGILIGGLVALKPNFLVWPAALLLAGAVVPAVVAVATTTILSLLPLALYGPTVYREWFHSVTRYSGIDPVATGSAWSLGALAGHPEASFATGATLSVLAVGLLALWARRRLDLLDLSTGALVVSLVASPITWHGYLLMVLPVFFAFGSVSLLAAMVMMLFPVDTVVVLAFVAVHVALRRKDRERSFALHGYGFEPEREERGVTISP